VKTLEDEYKSNGFVILKNILELKELEQLQECCFDVLSNHGVNTDNMETPHIDNPKVINKYFPRSHNSSLITEAVQSIVRNPRLNEIIRNINKDITISEDHTLISWMPSEVKKEFTGYHQDGPLGGHLKGDIHVWVPIADKREKNFKIIPKTHNLGNLPHSMFGQFVKVKTEYVEKFSSNEKEIMVNVGDILLFSTRALHCLTLNDSKRICWSLEFICEA